MNTLHGPRFLGGPIFVSMITNTSLSLMIINISVHMLCWINPVSAADDGEDSFKSSSWPKNLIEELDLFN